MIIIIIIITLLAICIQSIPVWLKVSRRQKLVSNSRKNLALILYPLSVNRILSPGFPLNFRRNILTYFLLKQHFWQTEQFFWLSVYHDSWNCVIFNDIQDNAYKPQRAYKASLKSFKFWFPSKNLSLQFP